MITPRQYQIEGVDRIAELYQKGIRRIVRQLPTGAGKSLRKGTIVLMSDGSQKKIEDIKIGDKLLGPDGGIRNVLNLGRGKETMYEVRPVKGDSYFVNESHILSLRKTGNESFYLSDGTKVDKNDDIVNVSLITLLNSSKTAKHCLKGWKTGPIEFNRSKKDLSLCPYILGVWLGDGHSDKTIITKPYTEMVQYWIDYGKDFGMCYSEYKKRGASDWKLISLDKINPIKEKLIEFNLINNKHIPEVYKYSSINDRLSLIAGLLDSDGHLTHSGYDWISKCPKMANDLVFICRSVGLSAYIKECTKKIKSIDFEGKYYRVSISGDCERIPCLVKKAEPRKQIKRHLVTGITLHKLDVEDYYGVVLDGDHLFVLGDFTVTHNTIEFAMLTSRFISKMNSNVVILVNREVLLKQTVDTLSKHFGIKADGIIAGARDGGRKQVKVAMVETGFNRIQKNRDFFGKVGLLIVDEAHYGEFKKMYPHFAGALIVAVTATPLFSTKRDPMKNYFDEIVTGPTIQEMIKLGSLMPNETHTLTGINTKKFGVKNGEFDQKQMGETYSASKHIVNCVKAYEQFCKGEKTIVFNCNIEHSKKVTQAFIDHGYNAKHLDGTESKEQTAATLRWFHNTHDAVLCNIMKLTAGFDEPSIINVILNYSTLSLTKYLQSTGRGSRPYPGKSFFRIIDMGGNYDLHGDWRDDRDWYDLFHNPGKPRETSGVSPIKMCQKCFAMIPAQAVVCKECGFIHERTTKYDTVKLEFIKVVEAINIGKIIEDTSNTKEWQAYFIMEGVALTMLKRKMNGEEITSDIAAMAFDDFTPNIKKWRSLMPRKDGLGRPYLDEYGQPLVGMPMTKNIIQFAWKSFHEKIEKYNKSIVKAV